MQDSLLMRHWAAHYIDLNIALAATARRAWSRVAGFLSIGSAYDRWTANHGPALLGGTLASIATTVLIGLAVTVLMPAVPASASLPPLA